MLPSANGHNGRDNNGRFAPGNAGGPGNPFAKHVAALRTSLLTAVTDDDVQKIVAALVKSAKAGDVMAAREVLDRTIGKPAQSELLQRVEKLEMLIEEHHAQQH